MRDGQGRTIDYLRLSVTDRCNCRCVYCMPAAGVPKMAHGDILSFEEMTRIVAAAAELGVRKVRLTGGEPLVRRGIVDLVGMVAGVPGIKEVAMTTNATLLAPVAGQLKAAGLTRLNMSLDSLQENRYSRLTRGGCLEDAMAGLEAARQAGFTGTKINCVLIGGVNDDEVGNIAALAKDNPCDVRFIELMPIGQATTMPREAFLSADAVLDALPPATLVATDGVARLYQPAGWAGRVGLISPMSHKFCGSCNRIRVTADGRLKACLHSATEVDLRGLGHDRLVETLRAGIAGKPAYHHMDKTRRSDSARDMNEIGG